ncbi:TDP-N-acetylfucosamine:lipid II N-acetylfucosaminyltransferase [Halomonas sp. M20]|uniref:TDP-N-acetylfucosamine:lipid II N-acetylfucosaminyltransferase n=1 Tax=Halomonas sp. M20 TaxID=2763264 RepID=UPI001D0A8238|nr:TDP-N-acetylfucosamine:lipid II N-acetylfucosaminyltransferase [Halomonas sp. M20]
MARSKKSSSKLSNRHKKNFQANKSTSLESLILQGEQHTKKGKTQQSLTPLEKAVRCYPQDTKARLMLSRSLFALGHYDSALEHGEWLIKHASHDANVLTWHASILEKLHRHSEAIECLQKALEKDPQNISAHNNIATLQVKEANYLQAERHFRRAWELDPKNDLAYSNMVSTKHYNPSYSVDELYEDILSWERYFASSNHPTRADTDRDPQRRLRIGLLSGGLRMHPVGQMVLPAIKTLNDREFEIFVYTTNELSDLLTDKFKQKTHLWRSIKYLSHDDTARKIREDKIDILIDLNGGGEDSRFKTLVLEPAPLQVKWVGSLFNTTGLSGVDYLISDAIETPAGVDHRYTERLIRMPDDYICYHRPEHAPATSALPALKNGHITFGCLNNPAKLNDELLAQWAKLMQDVAGSRLLLRGAQFESPDFYDRIIRIFKEHGIDEQRLILEGPTHHQDFLATYNRIDIALDTWPYSGGLTTCEALLMGVPVVTLPGPTFAGRHSATHLTNAGMAELVTHSWDEYRQRAVELAANLPDLSVIRACLRTYLLQSPVCDGPRFGKHLTTALRAIWQRHCEGKAPAALTFNKQGEAYFDGEEKPVEILLSSPYHESQKEEAGFQWNIDGKIIAIDNGAGLTSLSTTPELMKSNAFALIAFDPASRISDPAPLQTGGELHHYPHTLLGDGNPATLHVCLDPAMSATLEPLSAEQQPQGQGQGSQVLTTLPIQTIQLDSIEGLESIDWLILDNLNDSLAVLENGEQALKNTLLIQASVSLQPTHKKQPELTQISQWMSAHGFHLLQLNNRPQSGQLDDSQEQVSQQATQLTSADALYMPSAERLNELTDSQQLKLAFILHSAYGNHDLTHKLIHQVDTEVAERYLARQNYLTSKTSSASQADSELPTPNSSLLTRTGSKKAKNRFIHICFNNMHVQRLVDALSNSDEESESENHIYINKHRSVKDYDVDISRNSNSLFFDASQELEEVLLDCLKDDVAGIFFHGLFFDWQKRLVLSIGSRKKTIWVVWGGDLYRYKSADSDMKKVVEQIDYLATLTASDYEVFKKLFGNKPRFDFAYRLPFDDLEKANANTKEKLLIVGNSGDITNNHIEILKNLSKKKDINNYSICLPFSYNAPTGYKEEVETQAALIGIKENIYIIEEHMNKERYFNLISRAEVLITAQDRSQAGVTTHAAIYYGTKVVLKKNIQHGKHILLNPMWSRINKMKIDPISYEKFIEAEKISTLQEKNSSKILLDRENLISARGENYSRDCLAKIQKTCLKNKVER